MHFFYRISDKSYVKPKLPGATKEVCLMNFVETFGEYIFGCKKSESDARGLRYVPPMIIIADNCERQTNNMIAESGVAHQFTFDGNAGSYRNALDRATSCEMPEDEIIYFVEDDYLHIGDCGRLIEEGMRVADYVTLYDHPDKYTSLYGMGETSQVVRTESTHWRYTVSTTMTFAAKAKTLREDKGIWLKHTAGNHPHDHFAFSELRDNGRKLAVCIPGRACHTDLAFSAMVNKITIDPWAIDLMIARMRSELISTTSSFDFDATYGTKDKTGWELLVALDAIRTAKNK